MRRVIVDHRVNNVSGQPIVTPINLEGDVVIEVEKLGDHEVLMVSDENGPRLWTAKEDRVIFL